MNRRISIYIYIYIYIQLRCAPTRHRALFGVGLFANWVPGASKNGGKSGPGHQKSRKIWPRTPQGEAGGTPLEKKLEKGVRGYTCGGSIFAHFRPWIHFGWLWGDFWMFFWGPGLGLVFLLGLGGYLSKKYVIQGFENRALDCAGCSASHIDHFGKKHPRDHTLAPLWHHFSYHLGIIFDRSGPLGPFWWSLGLFFGGSKKRWKIFSAWSHSSGK